MGHANLEPEYKSFKLLSAVRNKKSTVFVVL
jgi:hypothetical protein